MQVFNTVLEQVKSMGLPVVAVSLTAVPRANTPVLLMLHWHGFAAHPTRVSNQTDGMSVSTVGIPGSALQLSDTWLALENLDDAMLEAAWQFGAWELLREERRSCNTAGASEREAFECRQAFAENPFAHSSEEYMLAEAPDRTDLMQLGARVGYVRWQFRPVKNGLWSDSVEDDTLQADGGREPPCPILAKPMIGTRLSKTHYPLGHSRTIIVL
jgi:hypothetical protein